MFGLQFIKGQPNTYFFQYRKGSIVREGRGISFFCFAPTSSLVAVPMESVDVPFIFNEVTADFQEVTVQGQVVYRAKDPEKLSRLMNFTLAANGRTYTSDDPAKLPMRVTNRVQVAMKDSLRRLTLKEALKKFDTLATEVREALVGSALIEQLGLEILDLSILAVKPNPETARALEAQVREQLLMDADNAVYDRRNAAVEQERSIKENELNTEIAVENKKRQIRETQMEADRALQEKRQMMQQEEMKGKIALEEERQALVALASENSKQEADAKAYGMTALMKTFERVDPRIMQALANAGMNPPQLIAMAFQSLADNASKVGNLNISPDLLGQLLTPAPAGPSTQATDIRSEQ